MAPPPYPYPKAYRAPPLGVKLVSPICADSAFTLATSLRGVTGEIDRTRAAADDPDTTTPLLFGAPAPPAATRSADGGGGSAGPVGAI